MEKGPFWNRARNRKIWGVEIMREIHNGTIWCQKGHLKTKSYHKPKYGINVKKPSARSQGSSNVLLTNLFLSLTPQLSCYLSSFASLFSPSIHHSSVYSLITRLRWAGAKCAMSRFQQEAYARRWHCVAQIWYEMVRDTISLDRNGKEVTVLVVVLIEMSFWYQSADHFIAFYTKW